MNLPSDFITYTKQLMGESEFAKLADALQQQPPTSVRLNRRKCCNARLSADVDAQNVAWCADGFYLNSRPSFTFDPLLHAGAYYVQEASSMFLWHVMQQIAPDSVSMLDLCAAPGGKSTVALSCLPKGSVLFSNEPIRQRANILNENILKFGRPDVIVTNNYPRDYQRTPLLFDIILADVPCSGEGMFRKDHDAITEWSAQNVERCAALQREIVSDIWRNLKQGGYLIYSTCTFNAHENEENVLWITENLGAEFVKIEHPDAWNIVPSLTADIPVCRFLPGTTRGEGLFMAVLRKTSDDVLTAKRQKSKERKTQQRDKKGSNLRTSDFSSMLRSPEMFDIVECGDDIIALPSGMTSCYNAASSLNILSAGITIGTRKGRDILPSQALALSTQLLPDAFPRIEIDAATAISYLRKESISLPDSAPRGFVILTFRGLPLGFVKNIGTRSNNLYPQEWRIKTTHLPETFKTIIE